MCSSTRSAEVPTQSNHGHLVPSPVFSLGATPVAMSPLVSLQLSSSPQLSSASFAPLVSKLLACVSSGSLLLLPSAFIMLPNMFCGFLSSCFWSSLNCGIIFLASALALSCSRIALQSLMASWISPNAFRHVALRNKAFTFVLSSLRTMLQALRPPSQSPILTKQAALFNSHVPFRVFAVALFSSVKSSM